MACLASGFKQKLRPSNLCVCLLLSRRFLERSAESQAQKSGITSQSLQTYPPLPGKFLRSSPAMRGAEDPSKRSATVPPQDHFISSLKELGFSDHEIGLNPDVLNLPLSVIKHRLQYCDEGGLNRNIYCIIKFDEVIKLPVAVLKSRGLLRSDINVPNKILSDFKFEGEPPPTLKENLPYEYVHLCATSHYLEHCFGFSISAWKRYRLASLSFTLQNIDSLRKMSFDWRWIRNHPSLLYLSDPKNLSKLGEIEAYGLPIKICRLIRREPNVCYRHGITEIDMKRAKFLHFLMSPDFVDEQFSKLKEIGPPENYNPLSLLYELEYFASVKKTKINQLPCQILGHKDFFEFEQTVKCNDHKSWRREMEMWLNTPERCSLVVEGSHHPFKRKIGKLRREAPRAAMRKLPAFVSEKLGVPLANVKSELSRLPLWNHVQVRTVQATLDYLTECGFTSENIQQSMQLVLYPRHIVEDVMQQHVISDPVYGSEVYQGRRLQLCLYYILTRYNYSLSTFVSES